MNKRFVLWMACSLWIGVAIGIVIGARWSHRTSSIVVKTENSLSVGDDVYQLNLLRTNDTTKAIEYLERKLDGDLITLDDSISNAPSSFIIDSFVWKSIQDAKEYRERFPSKNSKADQEISKVFLLLNSPTNR
jgi:hypothetical protein